MPKRIIDLRKKEISDPAISPIREETLSVITEETPGTIAPAREEEKLTSTGETRWQAPSFRSNPDKTYLALTVIALFAGAGILFFFKQDAVLEIFLMLSAFVLLLQANKKPEITEIWIGRKGVSVGSKLYQYKELRSFWIDYNPHGIKELSLQSIKWYVPYIKIPLEQEDPLKIRDLMISFVPEKMHEQSLADILGRKLGL